MKRNLRRHGTRLATVTTALILLAVAALMFTPAPALAQSNPPATPSSVTLTRADGTVTASWDAVSEATKYHVTYTSDNKASWNAAASPADNYSANSITINNVDNALSYIVGVRAGNDNGQWSGWRNSQPSGPYTPADPTPNPPGTPASVSVTRADGSLTATWPAVDGATAYHVTYSGDGGQSWSLATFDHAANSITISDADNAKTYVVGVRAKNAGGGSGWRNSPPAGPYTPPPTLTATATSDTGGTLTLDNYDGAWHYVAQGQGGGSSAQSASCQGPVNGNQTTVGGLNPNETYTITAYGDDCAGAAIASGELVTGQQSYSLTHSQVGVSAATLTRSGYTGTWYVKSNRAPYMDCTNAGSSDSFSLANLSSGASHTFTAYNHSYCQSSNARGSTTFTTTGDPLRLIENNSSDLTIGPAAGWTSPWHFKWSTAGGSFSSCTAAVNGLATVTNLRGSRVFVLLMYGSADCAEVAGSIAFKTGSATGLEVTSFDSTSATVTLTGWNRIWSLMRNSPTQGSCYQRRRRDEQRHRHWSHAGAAVPVHGIHSPRQLQ